MDLSYSAEYEDFRHEVRSFIEEHWRDVKDDGPAPESREALMGSVIRTDDKSTSFRLKAIERGYLYRGVPRAYGGGEQAPDPLKATIIREEFRKAKAPGEIVGQGASMLVPTLLEHGTEEQKQKFVRETLLGNVMWCQGYSEPGSGSDLASLRTKAELDGDFWVVNGQKIWTSNADTADWMFCLVRSEPEASKHGGISYLLIDMKSPGLDIRPLRQMTGDADFNEVFIENVRVPKENIVGERGHGWKVSRSTLKHERALIGSSLLSRQTLDGIMFMAHAIKLRGKPVIEDPIFRDRLIELESKVLALDYHGYRLLTMQSRDEDPGIAGMVGKLYGTTLGYEVAKLAMDLVGDCGMLAAGEEKAPASGMFLTSYMWSLGILIAGGTANVQRNVIGERGLGLPRDPSTKR